MRLVLDTNTAISGLLWGGTPGRLIDAAQARRVELVTSAPLLSEFLGVVSREKFTAQLARRHLTAEDVFESYLALVTLVTPMAIPATIARDPADDQVLAAAAAAQADLIVSGDAHLLDEGRFRGIEIVTAAVAVARIMSAIRHAAQGV